MPPDREVSADRARPREPWEWLCIIAVNGFLLIGGMLTSLTVYAAAMQRDFHWSEAAMGGGPVALLLGMSIGNLLVGPGMRQVGLRGLFSIGAALAACGWIAAGFVRSLPEFVAAMTLAGLGTGVGTIVPGIALISGSFHRRKGLAIALFIGACGLASSTMPMLTGALIAWLDWRPVFWIMGSACGLICVVLPLRLPRCLAGDPASMTDEAESVPPGPDRRLALAMPSYWLLTLALTLSQLCMNAVLFNVIPHLQKSGYDPAGAVRIYGIANLMSLPGLIVGGYISDRVSARIMLPVILMLQAAGTGTLLAVGSPVWGGAAVGIFIIVWGGIAGLPAQAGSVRLGELIGQRAYPSLLGILFTVTGFVGAAAPVLMGWAYEATGSYAWPLWFLTLLALIAALAALAKPPRRDPLPPVASTATR